jgi:hypothetical protein
MRNLPRIRMNDLVVQEHAAEVLVYDLNLNKAYCLNETSAMIWQLCDGTKTVAEIGQSLSSKLNGSITEDLVWLALDQFKRDNLLENNDRFEINFNGLSRRQVIKKIGFASMIMLPIVSSVVAPRAAEAASGLFANCVPCSSPAQCASNNCSTNRCAPAGNIAGIAPGPIGGTCPLDAGNCSTCTIGCCSGSTSFSPGSCVCT